MHERNHLLNETYTPRSDHIRYECDILVLLHVLLGLVISDREVPKAVPIVYIPEHSHNLIIMAKYYTGSFCWPRIRLRISSRSTQGQLIPGHLPVVSLATREPPHLIHKARPPWHQTTEETVSYLPAALAQPHAMLCKDPALEYPSESTTL